jgi:putative redox protein
MTSVRIERDTTGTYTATNEKGAEIRLGSASDTLSPVELMLAAIGGCTAIDVDMVTSRRAEPDSFVVEVAGDKVKDETGNQVENITVTFRIKFPEGSAGDEARAILPDIVRKSHDRLCTVSRTVERGTPVTTSIEP